MGSRFALARTSWLRLVGAVLCISLALSCPARARAAGSADWAALSTTIFRNVGEVSGTSATAIAQDGQGYLWVGSQSGLSRWDGYHFRGYQADPLNPDSLHDANINALHADRRGRLWIGTSAAGLARYDPARDRFVNYPAGPNGPSSDAVSELADDGADGLWVGTSRGLDHLDARTGVFEHFRHDPRRRGSLPDDLIRVLLRDDRGTLWVGTSAGLTRRDAGSDRFAPVSLPTTDGQRAEPASIIQDSRGHIWIGTEHHGVYEIDPTRARARRYPTVGLTGAQLAAGRINAISEVRPGELWFGTADHGIAVLDVATHQVRWLHHDPAVPSSLPENLVLAMYRDRAGFTWVGTLSGLRRTDPQQTAIVTVLAASDRSPGIADSDVPAIFGDAHDRAWLGFVGQGIDILDPIHGRIGALRPDRAHPRRSLPELTIRAIAGFPNGPVYIGTARGLFAVDGDGRGLRRIAMAGANSDHIDTLCVADGVLWIGTNGKGVWRLDPGAASPRRLPDPSLRSSAISVIAPGPRGHLWVGTYAGLMLLDVRSGSAERISAEGPNAPRWSSEFIASLLTDRRGRLWVGTFGDGILILDHLGPHGHAHIIEIARSAGLPNVNVDALLADRENRIWVATDDGIAVVDAATLAARALHQADGVEFSNYYLGARARLGNGDLLFGSTKGLTIVRPDRVRAWSYTPPVVVTDVRVGGKTVPPGFLGRGVAGPPIEISPQANSLAVEFAALDFSAPEQNRYAYRLDGYDQGWTETDAGRRVAAYTNLAPGTYTLELRGSNRDGVWSPTVSVPVRVLPAWYQTTACRMLESVAVLLLLAGLVQLRTAYLRRRERDLEQLVAQRTAELRATAMELRESKAELERIAYVDVLTNVPNRRRFREEFARLFARGAIDPSAWVLLLIDLDRFKLINDSLGHDAGDALLVEVASRLVSCVRASDCVARLGGDEFAMLLEGEDSVVTVERTCARIVASLARPVVFHGTELRTSASIGIAIYPQDGTTPDELYKAADTALYESKRAGRDTWRRFATERS